MPARQFLRRSHLTARRTARPACAALERPAGWGLASQFEPEIPRPELVANMTFLSQLQLL